MNKKEIIHRYKEELICPFCHSAQIDLCEIEGAYIDGINDIDCGDCGKNFIFSTHVNITWSSYKSHKEACED